MKPTQAFIFSTILLLVTSSTFAQYPGWQQKVNYNMEITVDTDLHQYDGKMDVLYENNSPDDLNKVFMYAFFNAFQPGSMMDVRSRNISDPDSRVGSRISELPEEEWGWIKDVILTMDGEPCIVTIEETILVVDLPTPPLPEATQTMRLIFSILFTALPPVSPATTGCSGLPSIPTSSLHSTSNRYGRRLS